MSKFNTLLAEIKDSFLSAKPGEVNVPG